MKQTIIGTVLWSYIMAVFFMIGFLWLFNDASNGMTCIEMALNYILIIYAMYETSPHAKGERF